MKKVIVEIPDDSWERIQNGKANEYDRYFLVGAVIEGTHLEEELEKIREEISMTNGCGDFIATYDIETLIDKHIAEPKGENNES